MSNENFCTTCKGSGLINPGRVCYDCEGTGKVKTIPGLPFNPSDYPEGTQVVTAKGAYKIMNGKAELQEKEVNS